jgi:hypothetical protein
LAVTDCHVCHGSTSYTSYRSEPSDWQDLVVLRRRALHLAAEQAEVIPRVRVGVVTDENGRGWLYRANLIAAGFHRELETFDLVRTYDGVVEVQGLDAPRRRYWIEPKPEYEGVE